MSDNDTDTTETEDESTPLFGQPAIQDYLLKGALVFFAALIVVATAGVYTSTSAAIRTWVATEYQPIFRAGFNLVVLLIAGLGISLVIRYRQE